MALGQAILVASETAPGLLQRVWAEMDFRLDVCRATKCGDTYTTYDAVGGGEGGERRISVSICRSLVTLELEYCLIA